MISYRRHNVRTTSTGCASALNSVAIKRMCLLMETTASDAFSATETNLVFHVCKGLLPPIPHPQLSQTPNCSGLGSFAEILLWDFQLKLCISWGKFTLNSQLVLLFPLGITLWVYEGLTTTQFIIKMQYPIIMPAVSQIIIHNCWKESELHLTTLGGN